MKTLDDLLGALRLVPIAMSDLLPYRFFTGPRATLFRLAGATIGRGTCLYGKHVVAFPQRLTIGANTFVNAGCFFDNEAPVTIGERCFVGPNVQFYTSSHRGEARQLEAKPISVGDDVWLGGACILLPGCRIDDGATIAAGAVMSGKRHGRGIYTGIPGRMMSTTAAR